MPEVQFISLIQLIQHPDKYHDQPVRVIGFTKLTFEAKATYVSRDDCEHAVTKNAIWLEVKLNDEVRALHGQYTLAEGTFDKNNRGHLGMYSGCIKDLARLEKWSEGGNVRG